MGIREKLFSPPKTVLLVGSGAVHRPGIQGNDTSWPVIERALNAAYGPHHLTAPGEANFVMANLVFKMRFNYEKNGSPQFQKNRENVVREYGGVVQALADELKKAQASQEISIRPQFRTLVEPVLGELPLAVITTNWDTLLDEYFGTRVQVMHLHGSHLDTSLMVLPSEVVHEKYRVGRQKSQLSARHLGMLNWILAAETVIIYGLSFSELDAELNQIVGEALRDDSKKNANQLVWVFNTEPDQVVSRLRHFDRYMRIEVRKIEKV